MREVCTDCRIVQTVRTRHCHACNRCVRRYDHHCFWLNACIGARNLGLFYMILWVLAGNLAVFLGLAILVLLDEWGVWPYVAFAYAVASAVLSGSMLLVVLHLLWGQTGNLCLNKTTSERFSAGAEPAERGCGPKNCVVMCCDSGESRSTDSCGTVELTLED